MNNFDFVSPNSFLADPDAQGKEGGLFVQAPRKDDNDVLASIFNVVPAGQDTTPAPTLPAVAGPTPAPAPTSPPVGGPAPSPVTAPVIPPAPARRSSPSIHCLGPSSSQPPPASWRSFAVVYAKGSGEARCGGWQTSSCR